MNLRPSKRSSKNTKTIAVVGLSDEISRPSYGVSKYMQSKGYRIIPVNPRIEHHSWRDGLPHPLTQLATRSASREPASTS